MTHPLPSEPDLAALANAQRHMVHAHTFCSQCVKHAANLDDLAAALRPVPPRPDVPDTGPNGEPVYRPDVPELRERIEQAGSVLADVPHDHDSGVCLACRRDGVTAAIAESPEPAKALDDLFAADMAASLVPDYIWQSRYGDVLRWFTDLCDAARLSPPVDPDAPREGLDVERLGLSAEQTAILRGHLASRQQTVSEWLGDVLMEYGLGRATGKEYPPAVRASPPVDRDAPRTTV